MRSITRSITNESRIKFIISLSLLLLISGITAGPTYATSIATIEVTADIAASVNGNELTFHTLPPAPWLTAEARADVRSFGVDEEKDQSATAAVATAMIGDITELNFAQSTTETALDAFGVPHFHSEEFTISSTRVSAARSINEWMKTSIIPTGNSIEASITWDAPWQLITTEVANRADLVLTVNLSLETPTGSSTNSTIQRRRLVRTVDDIRSRFFGRLTTQLSFDAGDEVTAHATFRTVAVARPVPEPATIALLGIGIAGLGGAEVRRRRKKKAIDKSQVIIY